VSNDFDNLESPSVQAEVNPAAAKLGDLLTLNVRVTHPPALAIDPPAFAEASAGLPAAASAEAGKPVLGTFEVYASTRLPSEVSGDKPSIVFKCLCRISPPASRSFRDWTFRTAILWERRIR